MQSWHLNCFNPLNLLRLSAHHDPMSSINANSVSTVAQLSLVKTERQMATAMQRLSTGLKINSAGDSPVGISTASLLNQKVLGLTKAVENVNSAVALLQVADGATAKLSDQLTRMRELAMQAVSDTLSSDQRGYLDVEFQELRKEAARTIEQTTWSGEPLLNGKGGQPVGEVPVYRVTSSTIQSESLLSSEPAFSVEGVGLTEDNLSNEFVGPSSWRLAGTLQASIANNRVTATYTVGDAVYTLTPKTFDPALGRVVFSDDDGLNGLVLRGTVIFRVEDENDAAIDLTGDTVTLTAAYSGALSAVSQGDLQVNGVDIGSSKAEDDTLSPPSNAQASAIARATAINRVSEHTGVHAKVNENIMTGTAMSRGPEVSGRITINGETTKLVSSVPNNPEETRRRLVFAINAISEKTGVTAINAGADERGMTLVAKDGRNIEISFETGADPDTFGARMGLRQGVQTASISLEAKIGDAMVLSEQTLGNIGRAGFREGDYSENLARFETQQRAPVYPAREQIDQVTVSSGVTASDEFILSINGIQITSGTGHESAQEARDAIIDAINSIEDPTVNATKGLTEGGLLLTGLEKGVSFAIEVIQSGANSSIQREAIQIASSPDSDPLFEGSLNINGTGIRASRANDDDVSLRLPELVDPASSAISIAAAVNEAYTQTGVRADATPAVIEGGITDTLSVEDGSYRLFLNGVEVVVEMTYGETEAERRGAVVQAINASFGLHGVEAADNGFGLDLQTRDGRNLSVWYDSSIAGLSPASFGLGAQDAIAQSVRLTLQNLASEIPLITQTESYIEYSNYGRSTELLTLTSDSTADVSSGAISVVGSGVYRGNGTTATLIGEVDAENNGISGKPLRINLLSTFANGDFNVGTAGSSSIEGWSTITQRIRLDGSSTIEGFPVPIDSTGPQESPTGSGSYRVSLNTDTPDSSGLSAQLTSTLGGVTTGGLGLGGTVHGPAIVSNAAVALNAGDTVSFEWKAVGGSDALDVYAYLLNVQTGETQELINATGSSRTDQSYNTWTSTATPVVKTVDATGEYKFVFVSGTWDATNGGAAGATLYIDNVIANSTATALTDENITSISERVVYSDSASGTTLTVKVNGQEFTSAGSHSTLEAVESLRDQINAAVTSGSLLNVTASEEGGELVVTSTKPGVPFTLNGLSIGGLEQLSVSSVRTTENSLGSSPILGISDATAKETEVITVLGGVRLTSDPPENHEQSWSETTSALRPISDQPQARPFTLTVGAAGYAESSSFYSLGFQTGSFGGQSSRDLSPPDVSRFTFQIGTVDDEQLSIDLPNLARVGSATREIVFGEPGGPDDSGLTLVGRDAATEVLDIVDRALEELSAQRANLGGASSRLALRITTLGEEQLNFSAARSAVEDLDYALEASELAKTQIMKEATTAVISQANTSMRRVLDLLRS